MAIIHSLSMTTPDDPAYEAKPSDWNAAHNQAFTILGNTAGASTISGTNIVLSAGPNATISVNGSTLVFSGGAGAAGNTGYLSDGAGVTASLGTVVFSNSNGLAFGINGQTVTGSYTVPGATVFSNSNNVSFGLAGSTITATATVVQTNQSLGIYNSSQTTGASSSSTHDARSLSIAYSGNISGGWTNGSMLLTVAPQTAQTQSNIQGIVVSNTTYRTGDVSFSNLNGLSFGSNGANVVTGSYTVPTVPAQLSVGDSNLGNTQGDTGVFTGRVVFVGTNAVSLSGSSNAGSATISINVATQTAQTQSNVQGIIVSNTTYRTGDVSFSNLNGISFGSNGANVVSASYTVPTVPAQLSVGNSNLGNTAGDTGVFTGRVVFVGSNNITLSGSSNAGSQTISIIGAAAGAGVVLYDGANSITSGTARFTNANGVSFTFNGQTISGSVAAQTNQTVGLYATGNTTGASSSSTYDARTLGTWNALGAMTIGHSNGSVQFSAPATSSLVGTSGISISTAGSTISVMLGSVVSNFPDPALLLGQYSTGQQGNGSIRFWPISVSNVLVIDRGIGFVSLSISTSSNSSHAGSISIAAGIFTKNASTLSAFTTGSTAHSWTNTSNNSTSVLSGLRAISCPLSATLTPGNYWLGVWTRTSTANANWFTASNLLLAPPATVYSGNLGAASTVTFQPMLGWGEFSATSSTLNNSYAFSHISGTGQSMLARPIFNLVNGTV